MLRHIEGERVSEIVKVRLMLHAGASAASNDVPYKHHFELAANDIETIKKILLPYVESEARSSNDDLIDLWIKIYGDPKDPKVRAGIDKLVSELNKKSNPSIDVKNQREINSKKARIDMLRARAKTIRK